MDLAPSNNGPRTSACPICGGGCGSRWQLAPIDSADRREAHWIGLCGWEWWLDDAALPDLAWARLVVADRHLVIDSDGRKHSFTDAAAALAWLAEEEYVPLAAAIADDRVPEATAPPSA